MKKRGVSRKFLTVALALGLLANAGGKPAFAKAREVIGSARATAIHDCNIEANKFSPITQLPTHAPPQKAACRSDVSARAGSVRHDAGCFAPDRAKCAPPSLHRPPLT